MLGGKELVRYVPEIEGLCDFDVVQPMNIDSTNMRPADWMRIRDEIVRAYDAYGGFVVLHGTDTMAYTAAALSYLVQGAQAHRAHRLAAAHGQPLHRREAQPIPEPAVRLRRPFARRVSGVRGR